MGKKKVSRGLVLIVAWTIAAVSLFITPASADVTSVSGGAFGASLNSSLLGQVLPPTPSVTLPPGGGGPFTDTALPIDIPGLISADVLEATTQGGNLGTHQGFAASEAILAEVQVGGIEGVTPPAIEIEAVEARCLSNGDGSSGSTDIVGVIAGVPIPENPTPNFVPAGPLPAGIASIVINEQVVQNSTGGTSIVVNAVHVQLLPVGVPGGALVDLIIGQARCAAAGPDVNTGQVTVVKDAPADAQNVLFTFTITCPGLAGSPFTRTVTGDGTTAPVINVPTGTVCTAAETAVPGFVEQPPQTFAPVASGVTRTVTFVNQRVGLTGSVAVVKDAPADAQGQTFTFTITCPGVAGSPFTRTVTGDGTSTAVTGLPVGQVCSVAETPVAGFVVQPAQNTPPVVANATQTVTFVNTRAVGTGQVAVVKDAPADAQNVQFTFTITCPGVAGSPFTRTATGDATTAVVSGIPVGTVCTAAETTVAGFNPQANQTFPAVTGTGTQTVTFVNTRVGDTTGSVAVIKDAPADAQNVQFTFTITCPGVAGSPFTRTATGDATTAVVSGIPAGTVCTAAETTAAGFNAQPNQTFPAVATGTTRTVTFVNTRVGVTPDPTITVQKSVNPSSRPQPGGTFTFTVRVTNTGSRDVVITDLDDDVYGDLDDRGTCETGATLDPGESYTCSFSVQFTGNSGATETNRVTVRATDENGRTVTAVSNSVTISITAPGTQVGGPTIIINNDNRVTCTSNATATADSGLFRIAQIDIDNNNSAECTSTATATGAQTATPRPTAAPTPVHTTPPVARPLPRTGVDTLALGAFALALMVSGWAMLSKPKRAGDFDEEL